MILIRNCESEDIDSLVQIHFRSKVLGMLGYLTPKQLKIFFYEPMLQLEFVECFIADYREAGNPVGAILVARANAKSPLGMSVLKFRIATRLSFQFFRNPDLILRLINYLSVKHFLSGYLTGAETLEIYTLLVDEEFQSNGVGTHLMNALDSKVAKHARIIVQTQNRRAVQFYSRFGFEIIYKKSLLGTCIWVCERNRQ